MRTWLSHSKMAIMMQAIEKCNMEVHSFNGSTTLTLKVLLVKRHRQC